MKSFNLIIVIILLTGNLNASVGTSGGKSLSIPMGVRAIGLGEAYCANTGEINSIYWNPAGVGEINTLSASATYSIWIDDIKINNLTVGLPVNFFNLYTGIGFTFINAGNNIPLIKQDAYENPVETGKTFGSQDIIFLMFGAKKINEDILIGINLKLFYSKIENEKAISGAADIGGIYKNIFKNLNFGFSIQNLGTKIKYIKEGDLPPILFKSGFSFSFKDIIHNDSVMPLFNFDVNKGIDTPFYLNLGSEIKFVNLISLRAGYKIKNEENNIRVGGGLSFNIKKYLFNINYAFVPYSEIGNTHRMELQFKMY